jgi:hypothetical protein
MATIENIVASTSAVSNKNPTSCIFDKGVSESVIKVLELTRKSKKSR